MPLFDTGVSFSKESDANGAAKLVVGPKRPKVEYDLLKTIDGGSGTVHMVWTLRMTAYCACIFALHVELIQTDALN